MAEDVSALVDFEDNPVPESPLLFTKGEALLLAEEKLRSATPEEWGSASMAAAIQGSGRYKSCWWTESAAFVDHPTIKLCCKASLGGSGITALFRTATGNLADIPSDAIIAAKRKVRLANQTANPPCAGCYDLQEAERKARDHLGSLAISGVLH